jgi:starvation-inducible DNA-binding protein
MVDAERLAGARPRGGAMEVDTGIDEAARKELAEGLSGLLADTYVVYLKTHGYHWNVTGPRFGSLHLMFEQQYVELQAAVDVIAERVRALGSFAPGSFAELARLATVPDEEGVPTDDEMLARLADANHAIARSARTLARRADEAGDVATADLATARIEVHEKAAWMLRSSR